MLWPERGWNKDGKSGVAFSLALVLSTREDNRCLLFDRPVHCFFFLLLFCSCHILLQVTTSSLLSTSLSGSTLLRLQWTSTNTNTSTSTTNPSRRITLLSRRRHIVSIHQSRTLPPTTSRHTMDTWRPIRSSMPTLRNVCFFHSAETRALDLIIFLVSYRSTSSSPRLTARVAAIPQHSLDTSSISAPQRVFDLSASWLPASFKFSPTPISP